MFPFSRFKVVGHSMEPAFKEGEQIIIYQLAYLFSSPKPGDIVAIKDPSQRGKILLKTIEKETNKKQYMVEGTNKNDSFDSRSFGPIDRSSIVGKFWFKY